MKTISKIIAYASLLVLLAPSILFLAGKMPLTTVKWTMFIATIVWFISAGLWMYGSNLTQQKKSENS